MIANLFEFKTDKIKWGSGLRVVVVLCRGTHRAGCAGSRSVLYQRDVRSIHSGNVRLTRLESPDRLPDAEAWHHHACWRTADRARTGAGSELGTGGARHLRDNPTIRGHSGVGQARCSGGIPPQHLVRCGTFLSRRDGAGLAAGAGLADWWERYTCCWRWCASSGNPPLPKLRKEQLRDSRRNPSSRRTSHSSGSRTHQFLFVLLKALAVTVGAAIGFGFGLPYGYWIPSYTLVVLQPDYEQTLNNFVQRMIGTILAATLAAVLLFSVHNQYLIALIILVSAFIAVAMHEANMLSYVFFITVFILLLEDISTPGSLTDVWARVLNVFIGALIAVVVVFLFMRPSQKTESSTSSVASG